ncbi:c-type cytochrome [Litorisediminicola beolgyonensis]|uniref:C-type cytochrome n=1 Tax=Litorisediminicola beolgyonensis TaxID=1173614 RepID=A0ABW3ZEN9_9RHOB
MFDTMTFTKVIGGFCGTLLVFLLGGWVAETVYHVGGDSHGEGEEHSAYLIEVDEGGEGGGESEEPADFETLWASADAGAGEKVFGKCRACHKLDGSNAVGPHLDGVVGRDVGAVSGFSYSGALSQAADVWTPENLFHFLENPGGYASGTTMSFGGLKSGEDRVNLIAYLENAGG